MVVGSTEDPSLKTTVLLRILQPLNMEPHEKGAGALDLCTKMLRSTDDQDQGRCLYEGTSAHIGPQVELVAPVRSVWGRYTCSSTGHGTVGSVSSK
jgi:hypothetical protein